MSGNLCHWGGGSTHNGKNQLKFPFWFFDNLPKAGIGHYMSLAAAIPRDWRCVILSADNIHPMHAINFINNTGEPCGRSKRCQTILRVVGMPDPEKEKKEHSWRRKISLFCSGEEDQGRKNRRKMRKILGDLTNIQQYERVQQYCN